MGMFQDGLALFEQKLELGFEESTFEDIQCWPYNCGHGSLTLDSSFLGRTSMPRCSPNGVFCLSLGVDPAILVSYPKLVVKRSQLGLFVKKHCGIYRRHITLAKMRGCIDILQTKGLTHKGTSVATGTTCRSSFMGWGKANATLEKNAVA
ncbi:hypothetical protein F4775DRAFT_593901 [Biscogniauxia sp. FL1348]|nr:hypothetical protein F4775DRAFT_593901 [Biscogniauxia sp. FL1348]